MSHRSAPQNWSRRQSLAAFVIGVVSVHALVTLFHLMMLPGWPIGRGLRAFYYSRSARGVKETWPLVDYYAPIALLLCVTAASLGRRNILIYLSGWIICCVTVLGTTPIYSTRLVPTPVETWGTTRPAPFDRPPDRSPFLPAATVFSVVARFAMNADPPKE
jgi:hypothetical protein